MGKLSRSEYRLDLPGRPVSPRAPVATVRPPTEGDREALAELMLDAYAGTIDSDGETIVEARAEVGSWLEGDALLGSSCVALQGQVVVAAVLASRFQGRPLISFATTRSTHKRQGLATALLEEVLRALSDAGETEVRAFITDGNTPSEVVFSRAGFARVPTADH